MTLGWTKGGNLGYIIKYNTIWANQKTESLKYCWLHAHAVFGETRFPTFVSALDINLSVLLIL